LDLEALAESIQAAVSTDDGYFLKTAYKSRKLNKRFNRGE
jgi:hypothetical protein